MIRCLNIDWLEVYALETLDGNRRDADYFRRAGFVVHEREYGTPMYKEMFSLEGQDGERLLEIRRNPKSIIFAPNACHIRLCNRTCYFPNAAQLLADFLERYGIIFQRVSRVDLCLDLIRFDYGDDPQRFVQRYMSGRYAKLNQVNIRGYGHDNWDQRKWSSLSWGSPASMVTTRFYNKTAELREQKDKPYIRQAWQAAGLVTDMHTLEKVKADGSVEKPEIWRLEFAVKSGTKNWFVMETVRGEKNKYQSIRNTLDVYADPQKRLNVFWSLVAHYFTFKHVEYKYTDKSLTAPVLRSILAPNHDAELKRKDRCADKLLFRFTEQTEVYKLQSDSVASATPKRFDWESLLQKLRAYRDSQTDPKVYKACNVVIERLETQSRCLALTIPWDMREVTLIRQIVAQRMNNEALPTAMDVDTMKALIELPDIFLDPPPEKRRGK